MTSVARLLTAVAIGLALGPSAAARAQEASAEGPHADDEAVPEPPGPVSLRPATVRFASEPEGVAVHYLPDPILEDDGGTMRVRVPDASRYSLLCETPCDRQLPQAHFGLAFSRGGAPIPAREPFGVDGPTGVRIRWEDREPERLGGLLALAIGIPLGLLVAVAPPAVELSSGRADVATATGLAIGGAVLAAAVSVGVFFVLREDGVSFSATPLPDAGGSGVFSHDWR